MTLKHDKTNKHYHHHSPDHCHYHYNHEVYKLKETLMRAAYIKGV